MNIGPTILLVATALIYPLYLRAVEVTEFEGGAHGFPALLNSDGKKLADGDFSQWLEGELLNIKIIYKFKPGQRIEEHATFRQKPELIQEQWSWREIKDGQLQREFAIDFKTKMATAQKRDKGEMKNWSEKIVMEP